MDRVFNRNCSISINAGLSDWKSSMASSVNSFVPVVTVSFSDVCIYSYYCKTSTSDGISYPFFFLSYDEFRFGNWQGRQLEDQLNRIVCFY